MGNGVKKDFDDLAIKMRSRVNMFKREGSFNMAFELEDWAKQLEELMQSLSQVVNVIWQTGKPPRRGRYLVTVQEKTRFRRTVVGVDYFDTKSFASFGATVVAWAEFPRPFSNGEML